MGPNLARGTGEELRNSKSAASGRCSLGCEVSQKTGH